MSAHVRGRARQFPQLSDSLTLQEKSQQKRIHFPHLIAMEGGILSPRGTQNLTGQGHEQHYQALRSTRLPKVPLNLLSGLLCLLEALVLLEVHLPFLEGGVQISQSLEGHEPLVPEGNCWEQRGVSRNTQGLGRETAQQPAIIRSAHSQQSTKEKQQQQ